MFDLSGKKGLVTGASGGIGRSIAKQLHTQGMEVIITGTRAEALNDLQKELGDRCHVVVCNLGDQASAENLISQIEKDHGQLDVLVNNAGITRDGLMMRMQDDDWYTVMDVNLGAVFRLSRATIKGMMKRRWGRIINITSIVGVTGNPGQANYAASKAGMIGMSKSLAAEVASRGITVNCIAPGFIKSAMTDALNDDQRQKIMGKIPTNRMGDTDDIANAALFLASNESNYITGQTLHVNGGMVMV